jgi:ProP effector
MTKLSLKTVPQSLLKLKEALEMGKKPSAAADQKKKTKETAKDITPPSAPCPTPSLALSPTLATVISKENAVIKAIPFKENERVQSAMAWLYETYPHVFNVDEKKPLKIGIINDLFKDDTADVDKRPTRTALRDALTFYTKTKSYQKSIMGETHRIDLTASPTEEITEDAKKCAESLLKFLKAQSYKKYKKKLALAADNKDGDGKI